MAQIKSAQGTSDSLSAGTVDSKLREIRRALAAYQMLRIALGIVGLAIVWAWAIGAADFMLELPTRFRAAALLGLLVAVAALAWRCSKSMRQLNELKAATQVERSYPEFGQGLRTAHQYATDPQHAVPAAPNLVARLMQDVRQRMQHVEIGEVVSWSRLALPITALVAAILVTLVTIAFVPETFVTAARLLLGPFHYTNVNVTPQDKPVPQSTDVVIHADVTGRPLDHPLELLVRPIGQQAWERVTMEPVDPPKMDALPRDGLPRDGLPRDGNELVSTAKRSNANRATEDEQPPHVLGKQRATIISPQSDLEYRVAGGPVDSPIYHLRVLPPLEQEALEAEITPPQYTKLPSETTASADVTVVEGSQLVWELVLSREPAQVHLQPVGGAKETAGEAAMPAAEMDGSCVRWRWDAVDQNQHFEVVAKAADGIEFRSQPIQVRVRKDRAPKLTFKRPAETLEVTPTTEVKLGLQAEDDYGLSRVGIEYDLGDGERHVLWEEEVDGESARAVEPTLFLEEHVLNFDDSVTYYAFAQDSRPDGKRVTSPLRFIDIRPYKREYQIVDGQCQGGGGGGCLTLEELIARQRHTLNLTFVNRDAEPVQEKLATRIARSQEEILAATTEFTHGWEARFGSEPALHSASDAMQKSLESVSTPDLVATSDHQSRALAALVKARKNLRQFVKNCSSGGQSACIKFDQQMAQQLRRPERKDAQNGAAPSPAEIQQQLDQLAQGQRQWSEQVAPPPGEHGAQLEKDPAESPPSKPKPNSSQPSQSQAQSKPGQSKAGQGSSSSRADLMAKQEAAGRQAESLQQVLEADPRASEAALRRMEELAEQIRKSAEEYAQADDDAEQSQAAEMAQEAAEQAESLREHLMGLMACDLSERLARADQLAQRIAGGQATLSQELNSESTPARASNSEAADGEKASDEAVARRQKKLAEDTKSLDDLLKHLGADTSIDAPEISRGIDDLRQLYPPQQVIEQMERTEQALYQQAWTEAASGAKQASEQSRLLAEQLRELHRQVLQPRLDDLLVAESKAAELLENVQAGGNEAKLAAQLPELVQRVAELNVTLPPPAEGFGRVPLQDANQIRTIMQALQAKIQEVVLLSAEMDADVPVPPQYQPLVEEYYRAISDDLR